MGRRFLITNDVLKKVEADPFTYYFDFDSYELIEKKDITGRSYTIPFIGNPQVRMMKLIGKKYRLDLAIVWCNENAIEYTLAEEVL
ncbi:MAG: hypothetical protein J5685_05335 [Clostridiales bacterium]|nr:hypothetical protein [Clostridiales bacterium]